MLVFIVRRLVVSFFIVLASTALTFLLVALSGNPLGDLLELRGPTRDAKIALRTQSLHLNSSIPERYVYWLQDVGRCIWPGSECTLGYNRDSKPVLPMLQTAIGSTLRLVLVATVLALVLGVVTGVITALRQYSVFDYIVTFVAFLCFSLPVFFVSTLLKQYVAIDLNTWLGNPALSYGALALISIIAGLFWSLLIGGGIRRAGIVFAAGFAATFGMLYLLLVTDFFTSPYFGIVGVGIFSIAAAVGWTGLFSGLSQRSRPVLTSAVATAVAGTIVVWVLQKALNNAGWLLLIGTTVGLLVLGVLIGRVLGGQIGKLAGRVSGLVGFTVALLMVFDRLLQAYPALFAATQRRPVPTIGASTPNLKGGFWVEQLDQVMHLILPTLAIMLISFAGYTRYTRASMLDVMGQDYVRTARAKGLNNRTVIVRHAFRNALIPLATLVAFDFAGILGGAVVTETVFGWNGMGKLFTDALTNVDPNPAMAFFLITAIATVIFNMLADIAYAYLDPRIKLG
ncbi:ABC transporter permease subunit [Nakamurella silvestris]|nr:ABC transporter permease subunit [Nakamurella silvestris]